MKTGPISLPRYAALAIVLISVSLASAQSIVWTPLWPNPQFSKLNWTLTVLKLPEPKSFYYWAFQDGFLGGGAFYFGLQPNGGCPGGGTCKVALFSFFGAGSTTTSPNCVAGADGGPGMSCHIAY